MIINAFKDKIFPVNPEGPSISVSRDEDEDRFYAPREVTPRNRRICCTDKKSKRARIRNINSTENA